MESRVECYRPCRVWGAHRGMGEFFSELTVVHDAMSEFATYRHVVGKWPELVCTENLQNFIYREKDAAIPVGGTPDC